MKKSYYIVYPAVAVGVGALSGLITRQSVKEVFPLLEKPPLSPPAAVFPIVWTALYILMGVGLAAVKNKGGPGVKRAERLWWVQLAVNFAWTLVFFLAGAYFAALLVLLLLFGLAAAMTAAVSGRKMRLGQKRAMKMEVSSAIGTPTTSAPAVT